MICPCLLLKRLVVVIGAIALLLAFTPLGGDLQTRELNLKPSPPFLGALTYNKLLDDAERLFENVISPGPESIAIKDGILYTGTEDGRIIRIKGDKMEDIVRVGGSDCVLSESRDSCGRPLGMKFDKAGDLVVADAVKGLYKVNVNTGEISILVSSSNAVDGKKVNFADDLAITKMGDIYFSDASTKWPYLRFFGSFIEHAPDGRILHYDPKTQKVHTLLDNLYFANGVELSPEEDFLLFTQSSKSNVMKYHLKGPKKGQLEIFSDNLPGITDNIRQSGRGTYWVAFCGTRLPEAQSLLERMGDCPMVRRAYFKLLFLLGKILQLVQQFSYCNTMKFLSGEVVEYIHYSIIGPGKDYGLIVELDQNGTIVRSLHSPGGTLTGISEVREHEGYLYIGSPWNPFLGKLKLS